MADIALPTPYRNPRDAFSNRQAIPGLDVREIQRATPDPAVAAATRARTASIGAPSIATPPAPTVQPTPAAPPGIASRVGSAVRNGARSIAGTLPIVAGPLAYQAAGQTLGDNTVSTPGVRPTGNSMVDQIPGAGGIAAPPQQAANYFRDTEPGRNINNAISALGGGSVAAANVARGAGGLVGAFRAGSPLQKTANVVRDIGQAVAASNATGASVSSIDLPPVVTTAQAAPVQTNPTDQRLAEGTQATPPGGPSTAAPPRAASAEPDVRAIEERASAINAQSRDIARQLDAYGPGGGGAGGASGLSSAPGGSASADRFNRESLADSQRQMAAGRGIGNMPLRGREAAAFQASASRALTEADQTAAGERIATARNIGEFNRATLRDTTDRRGQDIGLLTQSSAQRNARDIADAQGKTARDVATIGADGRIEAAANRVSATKFTPIQLPDEVGADGISTRKMGTALLNNQTGEIVYPTGGQPARPTAPKSGEVKNGYRFKGGDPSKAESWEKVQ